MIEGISYILLCGVGMPLKYGYHLAWPNQVLGLVHGVLSVVFFSVLLGALSNSQLSLMWAIKVFLASLIPFGALWAEIKLKQNQSLPMI